MSEPFNISPKIRSRIILEDADIRSALKQMDQLDAKLLLVFSNSGFSSLLSIGDIQRAIIKGVALDKPIKDIVRLKIRVGRVSDSVAFLHSEMQKFRMELMPVLDDNNQLVNAIFWEDAFSDITLASLNKLDIPVVIMAGGKGTRLKPITNIIPKALIPLGDKPIIEHIVDRFAIKGVHDFFVSVNYKKEMIQNYFEDIKNKPYQVRYFEETSPLGTAGSLYLLKGQISSTFFVTNCDILINDDYASILDYHLSNKNELTIVSAVKSYPIPYGIMDIGPEGLLQGIREKPEINFFINAGMYILEPGLLNEVPGGEFYNITDLISKLIAQQRRVGVFPVSDGSWMDIGEWSEYNRTSRRMGFDEINL